MRMENAKEMDSKGEKGVRRKRVREEREKGSLREKRENEERERERGKDRDREEEICRGIRRRKRVELLARMR